MNGGKLITYSIILLISFIAEIFMFFRSQVFIREFVLFWIFFLAAIILLLGVGRNRRWAAPWITVYFALNILNFIYLNSNTIERHATLFIAALIVSVIGLLVALGSIPSKRHTPKPEIVKLEKKAAKSKKIAAKKKKKINK